MINLPEGVAERLYAIYAATLANPLPPEEVVSTDQFLWAFSKGKRKPEQQLSWLHNLQSQHADLHEPYDMGVLNAFRIAMFVFAHAEADLPAFAGKPEVKDLQPEIDKANKRAMALAKTVVELQEKAAEELATVKKVHTDRLAAMAGEESVEIKKLKDAVKKLKANLKVAKSALQTASVVV